MILWRDTARGAEQRMIEEGIWAKKRLQRGAFGPQIGRIQILLRYILTFCVTDLKVNFMNKLNELELYQTLVMIIE